jgi:excisionase family DNA binding protein
MPDQPDELLTIPELALIVKLHPETLYRLVRRKKLPGVLKIGSRTIRVNRRIALAWNKARLRSVLNTTQL